MVFSHRLHFDIRNHSAGDKGADQLIATATLHEADFDPVISFRQSARVQKTRWT